MPKGSSGKQGQIQRSQALENKLASVEKKIVTRKTEKAVVLDDDGNVVFEKSGGKTSVGFTMEESAKMSGNTVTHNHPDESRHTDFSMADLRTAINANIKEIRAVNEVSQVSFMVNKNSPLRADKVVKQQFLNEYETVEENMNAKLIRINEEWRKTIREGIVTEEERKRNSEKFYSVTEDMRKYLKNNQHKYGYIYTERSVSSEKK